MTEDEPFIAGIRANPLDDLRRLVYADWLDERGRAEEAEYLRLVAALATAGTAVDSAHPHAVRLLALAERLNRHWRQDVGNRFDVLSDDPHEAPSLVIPYEAAVNTALGLAAMGSPSKYSIAVSTESSVRKLPVQDVVLEWVAEYDVVADRYCISLELHQVVLGHLRRILMRQLETLSLTDTLPEQLDQEAHRFAVPLREAVPFLDAKPCVQHWRERFSLQSALDGATADPPFSGWIGVEERDQPRSDGMELAVSSR